MPTRAWDGTVMGIDRACGRAQRITREDGGASGSSGAEENEADHASDTAQLGPSTRTSQRPQPAGNKVRGTWEGCAGDHASHHLPPEPQPSVGSGTRSAGLFGTHQHAHVVGGLVGMDQGEARSADPAHHEACTPQTPASVRCCQRASTPPRTAVRRTCGQRSTSTLVRHSTRCPGRGRAEIPTAPATCPHASQPAIRTSPCAVGIPRILCPSTSPHHGLVHPCHAS
jgi:hypothetical protein